MIAPIDYQAVLICNDVNATKYLTGFETVSYSSYNEAGVDTLKMNAARFKIFKKLKQIIVEKLGVEENEVTMDASFTNDLGADSLDTVELIMECEKQFNISIPDEDAEKLATVGETVSYLEKALKKIDHKKKSS